MQPLKRTIQSKIAFIILSIFYFQIILHPIISHANSISQYIPVESYISLHKNIAIYEMQRTGIPASVKLGQAILESSHGNSDLARNSNNHFGIKCKREWQGKKYYHKDDDRDRRGRLIKSCFRVYDDVESSFIDHSNFLLTRDRYAALFSISPKTDYKAWAYGLKACGYATAEKYAEKLITVIEKYQLYLYDFEVNQPSIVQQYTDYNAHSSPFSEAHRIAFGIGLKASKTIRLDDATPLVSKPQLPIINISSLDLNDVFTRLYGQRLFPVPPQNTYTAPNKRVFFNNGIPTIALKDGETLELISQFFKIPVKKLLKYNELQPQQQLMRGQFIYLASKKNDYTNSDFHHLKKGEDLYFVAQRYGIKFKKLLKYNKLKRSATPTLPKVIKLNNRNIQRLPQSK